MVLETARLVLNASCYPANSLQVKFEPAAPVGNKSSGGLLAGQQQEQQQQGQPSEQQQQPEQPQQEPLFPHLYGSIDFGAVQQELPMQRAADGRFLSIEGLP